MRLVNAEIAPVQTVDRDKILTFEKEMSTLPDVFYGDSESCPLTHKFAEGVYVREIFIPKGMCVVGKIHKHSHPNFLLKGEVCVITEAGGKEYLKAPLSIISPAGIKRIVLAVKDTVWVTVHVTSETDLEKIEEEVIAKTYEEFDKFKSISTNAVLEMEGEK
jgi:quercetin dioxygenase-like cupin family protein